MLLITFLSSYLFFPSSAIKSFQTGELLEWTADLDFAHDSEGTFCSRIEAYLQSDSDAFVIDGNQQDPDDINKFANVESTFTNNVINGELIGFSSRIHPFLNDIFPIRVEVGRRYKLKWNVHSPTQFTPPESMAYRLALVCVWPEYIQPGLNDYDQKWMSMKRRWMAVSEPFVIEQSDQWEIMPAAHVFDISPPEFYGDEDNLACPISMERFKFPVRTETGFSFDWESIEKIITKHEEDLTSVPPKPDLGLKCPLTRKNLDFIWNDEAVRTKLMKFTEKVLKTIEESDGWCFANKEAAQFNLETDRINPQIHTNLMGNYMWISRKTFDRIPRDIEDLRQDIKLVEANRIAHFLRGALFTVVGALIVALLGYYNSLDSEAISLLFGIFVVLFSVFELVLISSTLHKVTSRYWVRHIDYYQAQVDSLQCALNKIQENTRVLKGKVDVSREDFTKFSSSFGYPNLDVEHVVDLNV